MTTPLTPDLRDNPFLEPIKNLIAQMRGLRWSPASTAVANALTGPIIGLVALALMCFLPYGFLMVVSMYFWDLLNISIKELRRVDGMDALPHAIIAGTYSLIFVALVIPCLPALLVGYAAKQLSEVDQMIVLAMVGVVTMLIAIILAIMIAGPSSAGRPIGTEVEGTGVIHDPATPMEIKYTGWCKKQSPENPCGPCVDSADCGGLPNSCWRQRSPACSSETR